MCQVEFHSHGCIRTADRCASVSEAWSASRETGTPSQAASSNCRQLDSQGWLEVIYEGDEVIGDLRERLEAAISGTQMEILRVKNNRIIDRVLGQIHEEETLDDLNVDDVFERCLAVHDVPEDQRPELLRAYQETISSLYEDDMQAD